jgi:hypothetical protein
LAGITNLANVSHFTAIAALQAKLLLIFEYLIILYVDFVYYHHIDFKTLWL